MTNSTRASKEARRAKEVTPLRMVTTLQSDGTYMVRFLDSTETPDEPVALRVPDGLDGMTHFHAALAYAEAGWCVLPTSPNDLKNPGSVVGSNWDRQSSRDPAQIKAWWAKHSDRGIVLHMLPSRAIAFDLDVDRLPDLPVEMQGWLRRGLFQSTRQGESDRGHYVYALAEGEDFGNSAGAFAGFGEVRCRGVIAVAPSPHAKAADGGRYAWGSGGVVPPLLDGARSCLRAAPEHEADPLTSADLDEFMTQYVGDERPAALDGVLATFERNVTEGMSRHSALVHALPMAFREAVAGCYPAREAFDRVRGAFEASFAGSEASGPGVARRRSRPASGEVRRTAEWAAAQAMLADVGETLERLDRPDARSPDERLEAAVTKELTRLRASREARARLRAEDRTPLVWAEDIRAVLARGIEPVQFVIEDLAPVGSNVLLVAEAKAGKTTLVMNLVAAIVQGQKFLGRYAIDHLPEGSSITYSNFELSENMAANWLGAMLTGDPADDLHALHVDQWKGSSLNLPDGEVEDELVEQLRLRRSSVWVIDPYSAAIDHDENSNTETGAWVNAIDRIARRADLRLVVIAAHSGVAAKDGGDLRVRGATRLDGWQSLKWMYTHDGDVNESPPGTIRYLKAWGRDVDVPQFAVDYDRPTRILSVAAGAGGRTVSRDDTQATRYVLDVYGVVLAHEKAARDSGETATPINAGGIEDALGVKPGDSKPGGKGKAVRSARERCVVKGFLAQSPDPNNSKLYSVGAVDPYAVDPDVDVDYVQFTPDGFKVNGHAPK